MSQYNIDKYENMVYNHKQNKKKQAKKDRINNKKRLIKNEINYKELQTGQMNSQITSDGKIMIIDSCDE